MNIQVNDIVTIDYVADSNEIYPLFEYIGDQRILEVKDDGGKFYSASGVRVTTDRNAWFDAGWIKTVNGKPFNAFPDSPIDWKHPQWGDSGGRYDWKNHISHPIRENWDRFADFQKRLLADQAGLAADHEEENQNNKLTE